MNGIVSRNLKAIQGFIFTLVAVASALSAVTAHLSTPVAAGIGTAAAALTYVQVWLAKNEDVIKSAETAVDTAVSDVVSIVKPPAAPVVAVDAAAPASDATVGAFQLKA